MKKGFTLIELLAIIVVLGFIAVITVPIVNDSITYAAEKVYNANIEAIKKAASDWSLTNTKMLPDNGESIIVYLGELKTMGNIDMSIKNPKTGKLLSNNTSVTIANENNQFTYTVNVVEVDRNDLDAPLLVIEGDIVDYIEVSHASNFETVEESHMTEMPSAVARSKEGFALNNAVITTQIFKDDEAVSYIDLTSIGTYTVIYNVTFDGQVGTYTKKIVVRDTTKPELNIGDSIICSVDNLPSNLLADVTVSDNSNEVITPIVDSRVENRKGIYYVYYTAADSSGNSVTLRREVIVNE